MPNYAAKVEGNVILDVIVGSADWANARLDGAWEPVPANVSKGFVRVDGEFRPVCPHDGWTWNGVEYEAPVPMPDPVPGFGWTWDDETAGWVQFEAPEAP